jgi:hypothetical protein
MVMDSHLSVLDLLAFVDKAVLFADLKFCLWEGNALLEALAKAYGFAAVVAASIDEAIHRQQTLLKALPSDKPVRRSRCCC